MNDDGSGERGLGSCCICETFTGVTNILMLPRRAPIPGRGWGCVVCGLPHDGAVAVLCDGCLKLIEGTDQAPIFVCCGWPGFDGRRLFTELSDEPFEHDARAHALDALATYGREHPDA